MSEELRAECLRALRRLLILAVSLLGLIGLLTALLAWRIAQGPLDLTPYAARWMPLALTQDLGRGRQARLAWHALSIEWEQPLAGRGSRIILRARDLAVRDGRGHVIDALGNIRVACLTGALLHKRVAPVSVEVSDATLHVVRDARGQINADFPGKQGAGNGGVQFEWSALRRIDAERLQITLRDITRAGDTGLAIAALRASRPNAQWRGHGELSVESGSGRTAITIDVHPATPVQTSWSARLVSVDLAGFAQSPLIGPAVATRLAQWNVPASVDLSGQLVSCHANCDSLVVADLVPMRTQATLRLGAGLLKQPGASALDVHEASAVLTLERHRGYALDVASAQITFGGQGHMPVTYRGQAHAVFDDLPKPRRLTLEATAAASPLDFATFADVWPQEVIRGARKWVTRNIKSGHAQGLQVHMRAQSEGGLEALRISTLEGHVAAQDLSVSWLSPVPAAEHLDADVRFDGPDTLDIRFGHGIQPTTAGTLAIPNGSVRIDGILERRQVARIGLDASGDIAKFLALLSEKRLNLLSRHPLTFTNPSGPMEAHLGVVVPLLPVVHTHDIGFDAQARFSKIHLGNVVLGRPTDDGEGTLHATPDGLDVVAHNRLSGVPTDVTLHEDFTAGASDRVVEHIHATSHLDPTNALAAGIAPEDVFTGHAVLSADYDRQASGHADLALALDLADAGVSLPFWTKPIGIIANARAHLALQDGAILTADQIVASGPGLDITGHSLVAQGAITAIALDRFQIGRSAGRAVIGVPTQPAAPIPVHVDADILDLAPLIHATDVPDHTARHARSVRGWVIDCKAGSTFFSQTGHLDGVTAHLENDGTRLARGTIAIAAPTNVQVSLTPHGAGMGKTRHLCVTVDDIGHLMQVLGVTDRVAGGHARLDGDFADGEQSAQVSATPPFEGALDVADFAFLRPPVALTAASKLSVYDWKAATMRRFKVTQMHLSLQMIRPFLRVSDGHLGNDALGATIAGQADLAAQTLALHGTIVPVFAINALPGRLPGVGRVFSPEKGGGLIATTFRINGAMSNPEIRVQPLSMLLPGVLRKLVE